MKEYFMILINAILVENFILVKFLGICPFMGVSKQINTAIGMGIATTLVITISSIFAWLLNYIIIIPLKLIYLRTIIYILIISVTVQLIEIIIRKINPKFYNLLGIFLPLITTNCAVLGILLFNIQYHYSFMKSVFYAFSSSIGFSLIITLFASMREKFSSENIPNTFQGMPITLITAGLMSLIFMGFAGFIKNNV